MSISMAGKERIIEFDFGEVATGTATTRRGSGGWDVSLSAGRIVGREKDGEPGQRHMQSYRIEKAKYHTHTQRNSQRPATHTDVQAWKLCLACLTVLVLMLSCRLGAGVQIPCPDCETRHDRTESMRASEDWL